MIYEYNDMTGAPHVDEVGRVAYEAPESAREAGQRRLGREVERLVGRRHAVLHRVEHAETC